MYSYLLTWCTFINFWTACLSATFPHALMFHSLFLCHLKMKSAASLSWDVTVISCVSILMLFTVRVWLGLLKLTLVLTSHLWSLPLYTKSKTFRQLNLTLSLTDALRWCEQWLVYTSVFECPCLCQPKPLRNCFNLLFGCDVWWQASDLSLQSSSAYSQNWSTSRLIEMPAYHSKRCLHFAVKCLSPSIKDVFFLCKAG